MLHDCRGQIVITGVGKAGLIGAKLSATMASTGTPSIFLHPTEAVHGDLGRVRPADVVLALSHSGATREVLVLLDHLKRAAVPVIAMTSEAGSPLAVDADVAIVYGAVREACPLELAPSASTTCMLALGDALALTVMRMKQFSSADYAVLHPAGSLGLTFLRVERVMSFKRGQRLALAKESLTVREALVQGEVIFRRAALLVLVDEGGRLTGVLADSDLRRRLSSEKDAGFLDRPVCQIMVRNPHTIRAADLASEALEIMTKFRIAELPVLDDDGRPIGLIDLKDLVGMGIAHV
jgi:arabinose-5-phosphate isomerase